MLLDFSQRPKPKGPKRKSRRNLFSISPKNLPHDVADLKSYQLARLLDQFWKIMLKGGT